MIGPVSKWVGDVSYSNGMEMYIAYILPEGEEIPEGFKDGSYYYFDLDEIYTQYRPFFHEYVPERYRPIYTFRLIYRLEYE